MAAFMDQEHLLPESEYELMKESNMFGDDEIRTIREERQDFLKKIRIEDPSVFDYMKYITYERKLLSKINEHEETEKMKQIELLIINNLKNLYSEGLRKFPKYIRFWEAYIKFLTVEEIYSEISVVYEKMLKHHGDNPEVWLNAILWEYNEMHNMDKVKVFFFRSLQRHPENENLHVHFFQIILKEAAEMSSELTLQNNTESLQSLEIARVIVIYVNSKKYIHNIQYCCKLLKFAEQYPFTIKLQTLLVMDMMNHFSTEPLFWNTLAQREINGFPMCDLIASDPAYSDANSSNDTETASGSGSGNKRDKQKFSPLHLDCPENYFKILNTEEKWNFFLKAMMEVNKDLSTQRILKRTKLRSAFDAAHKANLLSAKQYFNYIEILREHPRTPDVIFLEVLNLAVARHPKSTKLWQQYMVFYLLKNDDKLMQQVFDTACIHLDDDDAYPLWKIMLQFYQSRYHLENKIEPFFIQACAKISEKYTPFRILYLEYIMRIKGFENARTLYTKLKVFPPPCWKLHETMANLERYQANPDMRKARQCYENAVDPFGKTSVEFWISYLRFERDAGNRKIIPSLFERAKKKLISPEHVESLIEHFNAEHS